MATASARVKAKMRDMKISDKEFFTSPAFSGYMEQLVSVPCSRFSVPVPSVRVIAKRGVTAYTDGGKITISSSCSFVKGDRDKKTSIIIGLMMHECGHVWFTDFDGTRMCRKSIVDTGRLPSNLPSDDPDVVAFESFLKSDPKTRQKSVMRVWHEVFNILEDGFVEKVQYYGCTHGVLLDGLDVMREVFFRTMPKSCAKLFSETNPLDKCLHEAAGCDYSKYKEFASLLSLMLMLALYDDLPKDFEAFTDKHASARMIQTIREQVFRLTRETDASKRLLSINDVFIRCWPLIEPACLDEEKLRSAIESWVNNTPASSDKDTDWSNAHSVSVPASMLPDMSDGDDGGSSDASESGKDDGAKDSDTETSGSGAGADHEVSPDATETGSGAKGGDSVNECADSSGRSGSGADTGTKGEEKPEVKNPKTDGDTDDPAKSADKSDDADGHTGHGKSGPPIMDQEESARAKEELDRAIKRVESSAKEEKAIKEVSEDLAREMSDIASSINYGCAHANLQTKVIRNLEVSEEMIDSFMHTSTEVANTARIMARKVAPLLKKQADSELPMSGLYTGSKFNAARTVMRDMRYFTKNSSPTIDTRLAVSVLVDESGSMSGHGRIDAARKAALCLYLFCRELGVPCAVDGHTAPFFSKNGLSSGDLIIDAYADYDDLDEKDKFRIMGVRAQEDNRDGAALLYCGTRLLKRDEPIKLLVVISDGAPCARGYSGIPAENDMSKISAELTRQGIVLFALAIGNDKENIHRIYGDRFIDITDLANLPIQMVQLVKRYIR